MDVHVQGKSIWQSQVSMELSRAIAEEQTALAAVLSDLKRQKVLCIQTKLLYSSHIVTSSRHSLSCSSGP